MSKDPSAPKPNKATDDEVSDEVLKWISGGASTESHGCPACPHPTLGPAYKSGSHILVDGSIYQDGVFTRKL
jgi:hypothetical protein